MALNIIDFSRGIRPEEIQENFNYLQDQLSRERISVGGAGIASGLDITTQITDDLFIVKVSSGAVIDEQGNEVFIEGKDVPIEPPILYQYKELITLDKERTASLRHRPYALSRRQPSELLNSFEPEFSGIYLKYENSVNKDDYIRVRDIMNKTIIVAGALSSNLEVTYSYTARRIDALYLDKDFNIKVAQGTTDTTPSAPSIPIDATFLIAYLEIDNEYKDENNTTDHAYIYVKDDLKKVRNLYTDSKGDLYVCGIPFDDLQIIHMKEPTDPKVNTLWLNLADNTLYCWRATDEFTYKNKIDIDTDFLNETEADLIFSTYMDFTVDGDELSVYLNDVKLLKDRDYEEIKHDSPTYAGNVSDEERGNTFRILQTIQRPDNYEDLLVPGDTLTYMITYRDSQYMWVPINKMNYINAKNTKVYSTYYDGINEKYIYEINPENQKRIAYFDSSIANSLGIDPNTGYPNKYQYFLFDRISDLNLHFTPHRKELSVLINQMPLHEDQFKEITVFDLYEKNLPYEVLEAAAEHYGWSTQYLQDYFNGEYDNSGIGFMLVDPLDSGLNAESEDYTTFQGSHELFVEAIVERRICSTPINHKLERSATFVYEDYFVVDNDFARIIDLGKAKYRYNEHQLEVFVDGVRQVEGIDYIEEFGYLRMNSGEISTDDIIYPPINEQEDYLDQDYFIRKKAALCNMFAFLPDKDIAMGSVVSFKITTNIYSYDHINTLLDGLNDTLKACETAVKDYSETITLIRDDLFSRVETVENRVADLSTQDKNYLTTESILNLAQMPNEIVTNSIKSLNHINTSVALVADKFIYTLTDIWPEDYVNVFYHNTKNNYDNYLVKGLHYKIVSVGTSSCYLEILSDNLEFATNDVLYISGIKLSSINRSF